MRANLEDQRLARPEIVSGLRKRMVAITLAGNYTMLRDMPPIVMFDAGGSNRNITMPSEANTGSGSSTVPGSQFFIQYIANIGTSGNLVIKDSTGATTLRTIPPGQGVMMFCDGTTWRGLDNRQNPASGAAVFAAGTNATTNGSATTSITVTGAASTDISIVTVNTADSVPVTVKSSVCTTNAITVTMSGSAGTGGTLNYLVLRP